MAGAKADNARAVVYSALLHLALLGFLLMATLSCTQWTSLFGVTGLPPWMNPVQCRRAPVLAGPVIEAELVGLAAAPRAALPKPQLQKPRLKPQAAPPPPPLQVPNPKGPRLPVPTLPPPPQQPDLRTQQRVVDLAQQKAEQARQTQVERQQQHMSEVDAAQNHLQKVLAEMNALRQQRQAIENQASLAEQKQAQLKDLHKQGLNAPDLAQAAKPVTGAGGQQQSLAAQYQAALVQAIESNWLRPDNIPRQVVCPIHIVQIPGGKVISVTIEPSCPYDAAARQSVQAAVLRASPLPYQGFESVFSSDLTVQFSVNQ